jgi:hypothetical protein
MENRDGHVDRADSSSLASAGLQAAQGELSKFERCGEGQATRLEASYLIGRQLKNGTGPPWRRSFKLRALRRYEPPSSLNANPEGLCLAKSNPHALPAARFNARG